MGFAPLSYFEFSMKCQATVVLRLEDLHPIDAVTGCNKPVVSYVVLVAVNSYSHPASKQFADG